MENNLIKYSIRTRKEPLGGDTHWDYCCTKRIPYVRIRKKGTRYWLVDYNLLPVVLGERFTALSFQDYTPKFFDQFIKEHSYPKETNHRLVQLDDYTFILNKEDAHEFAERLFDYLTKLAVQDKELFDKKPIYVDQDGYNSDLFHVAKYGEELACMSDSELILELTDMKMDNPNYKQTIQLITNEISKRKTLSEMSGEELSKLSAKDGSDKYLKSFLKNLNS